MAEWLKAPVLKYQATPNPFKTIHILLKSLLTFLNLAFTKNTSLLACLSYETRDKLETKYYLLQDILDMTKPSLSTAQSFLFPKIDLWTLLIFNNLE